MSGFLLRDYLPDDLLALFRLDQVCFEPRFQFSLHAMRDFAEGEGAVTVVAEADGELVGFAIAEVGVALAGDLGSEAYLATLDVHPDWRREGLARAMMGRLEEQLWELGSRRMSLHVFVGNEGAIRFYERLGFVRMGTSEGFYDAGTDAYFYVRSLIGPANLGVQK